MLILESTGMYNMGNAEPFYGDIAAEIYKLSEENHDLEIKMARAEFQAFVNEDTQLLREAEDGFWARIKKWFIDIWNKIKSWFKGTAKDKEEKSKEDLKETNEIIKDVDLRKVDWAKLNESLTTCIAFAKLGGGVGLTHPGSFSNTAIFSNGSGEQTLVEFINGIIESINNLIKGSVSNINRTSTSYDKADVLTKTRSKNIVKFIDNIDDSISNFKRNVERSPITIDKSTAEDAINSQRMLVAAYDDIKKLQNETDKYLKEIIEVTNKSGKSNTPDPTADEIKKDKKAKVEAARHIISKISILFGKLVNLLSEGTSCLRSFVDKIAAAEVKSEGYSFGKTGSILDQF
jgi:hypothetical protein